MKAYGTEHGGTQRGCPLASLQLSTGGGAGVHNLSGRSQMCQLRRASPRCRRRSSGETAVKMCRQQTSKHCIAGRPALQAALPRLLRCSSSWHRCEGNAAAPVGALAVHAPISKVAARQQRRGDTWLVVGNRAS
jgi:hypothetical protein